MDKPVIGIAALSVVVLGAIIIGASMSSKNFSPRTQCVEHSVGLSMHIHPMLSIFVDDQPVTVPANIGIEPTCMRAIHTHDETGKIHIESPTAYDFYLGDFFANWGQPFSATQLMDKTVDDTHTLSVTVDGQPNTEFDKLKLADGQQIVIRYETKK